MLPVPFSTVIAPFSTFHLAGLCSLSIQLDRSFPSNKMIASEGGSCEVVPGVIAFGSGSQTSVDLGSVVWE
jgi:hypothetical protein